MLLAFSSWRGSVASQKWWSVAKHANGSTTLSLLLPAPPYKPNAAGPVNFPDRELGSPIWAADASTNVFERPSKP